MGVYIDGGGGRKNFATNPSYIYTLVRLTFHQICVVTSVDDGAPASTTVS